MKMIKKNTKMTNMKRNKLKTHQELQLMQMLKVLIKAVQVAMVTVIYTQMMRIIKRRMSKHTKDVPSTCIDLMS